MYQRTVINNTSPLYAKRLYFVDVIYDMFRSLLGIHNVQSAVIPNVVHL